jgi:hypothetical protein
MSVCTISTFLHYAFLVLLSIHQYRRPRDHPPSRAAAMTTVLLFHTSSSCLYLSRAHDRERCSREKGKAPHLDAGGSMAMCCLILSVHYLSPNLTLGCTCTRQVFVIVHPVVFYKSLLLYNYRTKVTNKIAMMIVTVLFIYSFCLTKQLIIEWL